MPPLPRLQLDVGPGMAVDLPHDIIRPAGKGQAGLCQAQNRVQLPFQLLSPPPSIGLAATSDQWHVTARSNAALECDGLQRSKRESIVTRAFTGDDQGRAIDAFCP